MTDIERPTFQTMQDRAIADPRDDLLGRDLFVRRLARALISPITSLSNEVVIGLQGQWGVGKTSLLNLIEKEILKQNEGAVVLRFDPWLVSTRDDLVRSLLVDLAAVLEGDTRRRFADAVRAIRKYAAVIEPLANWGLGVAATAAGLPPVVAVAAGSAVIKGLTRQQSLQEIKAEVTAALQRAEAPVVILIDELDRLERAEVKAMAQAVRAVADFPRVAYVLAYDADRVAHHLGDGDETPGRDYLQKIVQVPIVVPEPSAAQLRDVLNAGVQELLAPVGIAPEQVALKHHEDLLTILVPELLRTVRDVKRVLATFQVEAAMIAGEVNWSDLLGWAALRLKRDQYVQRIRADPEAYVNDPPGVGRWAVRTGEGEEKLIQRLLGTEEKSDRIGFALVRHLFPTLRSGDLVDDLMLTEKDRVEERLQYHYPLRAALALGSVPGYPRRAIVVTLLAADAEGAERTLRDAVRNDNLPQLISRIDDLLWKTDGTTTLGFWEGVRRFLQPTETGWLDHVPNQHSYPGHFERLLLRAVKREAAWRGPATTIVERLAAHGDLTLLPLLLWDHWAHHGLWTDEAPSALQGGFLDRQRTIELSEAVLAIWHRLMVEGSLLPDLIAPTSLFMLHEAGRWDAACQSALHSHLATSEGFDNFLLLLFGRSGGVSRKTVERFIPAADLIARMQARDRDADVPPAVRTAIQKASGRLSGPDLGKAADAPAEDSEKDAEGP